MLTNNSQSSNLFQKSSRLNNSKKSQEKSSKRRKINVKQKVTTMTEPSIMAEVEPGVQPDTNTLFYLRPIQEIKSKKSNMFLHRRILSKQTDAPQQLDNNNLVAGENFNKEIGVIMDIIDGVESNMQEDKLSTQFKNNHI